MSSSAKVCLWVVSPESSLWLLLLQWGNSERQVWHHDALPRGVGFAELLRRLLCQLSSGIVVPPSARSLSRKPRSAPQALPRKGFSCYQATAQNLGDKWKQVQKSSLMEPKKTMALYSDWSCSTLCRLLFVITSLLNQSPCYVKLHFAHLLFVCDGF